MTRAGLLSLSLEIVMMHYMLREPGRHKSRVGAIAARGKMLSENARYFVGLVMRWIMNDLVYSRVGNLFTRLKYISHFCHMKGSRAMKPPILHNEKHYKIPLNKRNKCRRGLEKRACYLKANCTTTEFRLDTLVFGAATVSPFDSAGALTT
jgi:hypothetical protein